jgi:hypothetical protein
MSISWEIPRLSCVFLYTLYLLNINDMYILFATNTVKNCLYLASKVKNEKLNTVNRYGILPRIIMSSLIPIEQVMTRALGFFKELRPLTITTATTTSTRLAAIWDQVPSPITIH